MIDTVVGIGNGARPARSGRGMLGGALMVAAAWLGIGGSSAQESYPTRPVRVVVGFGPGGIADISMRIVADKLSATLGQRIIVENQPAAGGVTAAKSVLSAPADGYTLALLTNGTAVSASLL